MARVNFQDALNTKGQDIEAPKRLPQGDYIAMVKAPPTFVNVGQDDRWECTDFNMQIISATEGVNADELAEYGNPAGATLRHRFMFDSEADEETGEAKRSWHNTLFALKRFLSEHLQVDGTDKKELKQSLADAVNHQCIISVKWRPDTNNPEQVYTEISRTAPVE